MIKVKCEFTEMVDVDKLVEHPRNANKHPERQIELLSKNIKHQGWRLPIVVSKRSGFLVAGHGRLEAAKMLGASEVPVSYQDFESEAEEYQFLISDNKLSALAEHDDAFMIEGIKELGIQDFELLGLDNFHLPDEPDPAKEEIEDDVPTDVDARCKPGDLWILGDHRLLCGDSTNIQHVERLMGGESPILMVTDPPYGVNYDPEWRKKALGDKFMGKVRTGKVSNDDNADWTDVWSISPSKIFYIWHSSQFDHIVKESLQKSDYEVRQQIIWVKTVAAMGRSAYHWKHEPCLYGVKKGSDANWKADRKQTTVWEGASPIHIMSGSKEEKTGHPTQKPIFIYEKPINHHTVVGDGLYDPFGGSGSAVIACEKTNRKCYMAELDPYYCDVIINRWMKYAGKTAYLVESSSGKLKEPVPYADVSLIQKANMLAE